MNEVINAILERRSIRAYQDKPVSAADRDLIVKAGMYAPSTKNSQPWHVSVLCNRGKIDTLTTELKAALIRNNIEHYLKYANSPDYAVNFKVAPIFMIVSANPEESSCAAQDAALVLGNMFLAAHSLGIASCWINQLCPVCDDPQFRALLTEFGVPAPHKVYGAAAFGYAANAHPQAPARREGTVSIIE